MTRILIVGDERRFIRECLAVLQGDNLHVFTADESTDVLIFLTQQTIDAVIVDIRRDTDGVKLLKNIKLEYPLLPVIMIVGLSSVSAAVKCMKFGAYDCLTKPVQPAQLAQSVLQACEQVRTAIPAKAPGKEYEGFMGKSRQIIEIKKLIALAAPSDAPVLILGETGTGKDLVARAIHLASDRCSGPFVAVNASALPESIAESELFGYAKGAFTGAVSDKAGLLESAHGGTFFIDEVADMDPAVQAKLLRVIETGTFRKIGDTREIRIDVRFVSATNKDLEGESERTTFRTDLFFRLSTVVIEIPPLRERKDDIPLLTDYFLRRVSRDGVARRISPQALSKLVHYCWPGNVRELAHTIERAVILSSRDTEVGTDVLPLHILQSVPVHLLPTEQRKLSGTTVLEDAKRQHIVEVLRAAKGNKTRAARILGISRSTLYRTLYGPQHFHRHQPSNPWALDEEEVVNEIAK